MQLTQRNITILKIIIEEFLKTWTMIGSKSLLLKYDLWVSPATVRADMAKLEKLNLVYQPYNSAWRLPTTSWIRAYIEYIMQETPSYLLNNENIDLRDSINNFSDFIYNKLDSLSKNTKEISFFSIPSKNFLSYNWINFFIEKNSKNNLENSINIIKMLEDKIRFIDFLDKLTLKEWINLYIWEENNLKYLKNFSIIIKSLIINNQKAYIWIIWNLYQNYSFNISALKSII